MDKKTTKRISGKASAKRGTSFYDRVRLLADTTLRHSRDTVERTEALEVIRLMEEKAKAA